MTLIKKQGSSELFLDIFNLYGGKMMKKQTTGGFQWSNISLDEIIQTLEEIHVG